MSLNLRLVCVRSLAVPPFGFSLLIVLALAVYLWGVAPKPVFRVRALPRQRATAPAHALTSRVARAACSSETTAWTSANLSSHLPSLRCCCWSVPSASLQRQDVG